MLTELVDIDLPQFNSFCFFTNRSYPEGLPSRVISFIEEKERRMGRIFSDPQVRERIVDRLFNLADKNKAEYADFALVLGTSFREYPDKFKKRVYWASMLWYTKQVNRILFTGKGDAETDDVSQSEDAKDMAVSQFNVPANAILVAGGDNTQQNVLEAKNLIPLGTSIFLVSDGEHLIRGVSVARQVMGSEVSVFPHPVGGLQRLNPHHPRTIIELIKAEGYNHTSYRINSSITKDQSEFISQEINKAIKYYEAFLRQIFRPADKVEKPFDIWAMELPPKYRLLKDSSV